MSGDGTYSLVREGVSRDTLGLHTPHERDVGGEDRDPRQTAKDSDGRGKVVKDLQGIVRGDKVGETHETTGEGESDPWDTSLVANGEDPRGVAVLGHSVKGSRGDVLVRVGRRDREDQDAPASPSARCGFVWSRPGDPAAVAARLTR